ncbi:MAG TPA: signal peptidase I [Patescibacteria group bacterium]
MNKFLKFVLGLSIVGVAAVVLVPVIFLLLYLFVFKPVKIVGLSMAPSYKNGQYYMVNKLGRNNISRGDVIIFRVPPEGKSDYIQRVVGLPGEKVKIEKGKVYINGQVLNESYLDSGITTNSGTYLEEGKEVTIPENKYVTFGDNRDHSLDSRIFGFLPRENVVGKVWFCYFACSL